MESKLHLSEKIPNLIAAFTSKTRGIGYNNDLPWKRSLSMDLKWLNYLTTYKPNKVALIMGKNTFVSIRKPLSKRVNIVVSSQTFNDVVNVKSVDEALNYASQNNLIPVFFGGSRIFEEALRKPCKVFFTVIQENDKIESDAFFPEYNILLDNITYEVNEILTKTNKDVNWMHENGEVRENGYNFSFYVGINE